MCTHVRVCKCAHMCACVSALTRICKFALPLMELPSSNMEPPTEKWLVRTTAEVGSTMMGPPLYNSPRAL